MSNSSWLHPLTGLIFVALAIVSFTLGGEPPDATEDSVQEVIEFYVDNDDAVTIGGILQGIAGAFLVMFGGYLFKRLRASGAEATAVVAFAGTLAFGIGIAIDGSISVALSELANGDETADPGAVQALSALWNNDFVPFAMGLLLFLWGFGIAIVRHGALPTWMGWVAIVAGVTAISPAFFVGAIVALILVVASAIVFAREERAQGSAATA